jgi:hypothetical protein
MTEEKKEPIFTINREDGSSKEVFESDLDEKTMPLANELSSVNRSIQYKRNSELYQQAIHLTQDLRSLERDSNNLAAQLDEALESNNKKVEVVK